jgi:arylsulfatase A-like enzyme
MAKRSPSTLGAWMLVTQAYNLKRLFLMGAALSAASNAEPGAPVRPTRQSRGALPRAPAKSVPTKASRPTESFRRRGVGFALVPRIALFNPDRLLAGVTAATKPTLTLLAALLLAPLAALHAAENPPRKPNVLIILSDDQGFDDLSLRGRTDIATPNLDTFAKQSVQFPHFYTDPSCAPTRASLLTGRYFARTGVFGVRAPDDSIDDRETLMPEVFQQAGYRTAVFGKWHNGVSALNRPEARGFDTAVTFCTDSMRWGGFYKHLDPFFHENGKPGAREGWSVGLLTDRALQFMGDNRERPFFLYLAYASVHEPWQAEEQRVKQHLAAGRSLPHATLCAMTEQLDAQVGRLLQGVKELGLEDNTVVVFSGDNGATPKTTLFDAAGRALLEVKGSARKGDSYTMSPAEWAIRNPHGLRGKKATVWENGIRNNLFIRYPARCAPRECNALAHVTDIFPTLAEFCGIELRGLPASLDGRSLAVLADGGADLSAPRTLLHLQPMSPRPQKTADGWTVPFSPEGVAIAKQPLALREGRFKLVQEAGSHSLFDLDADPKEQTDLAASDPARVQAMLGKMKQLFESVCSEPHAYRAERFGIVPAAHGESVISAYSPVRYRGDIQLEQHYAQFSSPGAAVYQVKVSTAGRYRLQFQSWQGKPSGAGFTASVAGNTSAPSDSDGRTSLSLPAGDHEVLVRFQPEPARQPVTLVKIRFELEDDGR